MPRLNYKILILLGLIVCQNVFTQDESNSGNKFSLLDCVLCGFSSIFEDDDNHTTIDHYYHEIDDRLKELKTITQNGGEDTVEYDMRAAIEWLKEVKGAKRSEANKGLVKALEQFTSLSKIQGTCGNRCSRNSVAILLKNSKAAEILPQSGSIIVDIVREYSSQHAKDCHRVYPVTFKTISGNMDKEVIKRVERFANNIFWWRASRGNAYNISAPGMEFYVRFHTSDAVRYIFRYLGSLDEPGDERATYDTVESLAKEHILDRMFFYRRVTQWTADAMSKVAPPQDRLVYLFDKYLVEPCRTYIKELGPNVFEPIKYDYNSIGTDNYEIKTSKDFLDLYLGLHQIKTCQLLVEQDQLSLLEHMLEYVYE